MLIHDGQKSCYSVCPTKGELGALQEGGRGVGHKPCYSVCSETGALGWNNLCHHWPWGHCKRGAEEWNAIMSPICPRKKVSRNLRWTYMVFDWSSCFWYSIGLSSAAQINMSQYTGQMSTLKRLKTKDFTWYITLFHANGLCGQYPCGRILDYCLKFMVKCEWRSVRSYKVTQINPTIAIQRAFKTSF